MTLNLRDFNVSKKRVLVREDYDVPLRAGKILEDSRIRKSLETIEFLLARKARVVLIAHLGRPNAKKSKSLSLKPVAEKLSFFLKNKVFFSTAVVGSKAKEKAVNLKPGEVLLLENLRFKRQEEENNFEFAKKLASLADFYVNDAFAASHRRHASITGVPFFLPSCLGFGFSQELKSLKRAFEDPKRPFLIILGGVKESKLENIDCFLKLADKVLVGGKIALCKGLKEIKSRKLLVADLTWDFKDTSSVWVERFKLEIEKAGTIVWAGPLGMFERKASQKATKAIAQAIADSKAFTVVGGGDTRTALTKFNLTEKINYISSGGGAMLYFLANRTLPGLEVLKKQ